MPGPVSSTSPHATPFWTPTRTVTRPRSVYLSPLSIRLASTCSSPDRSASIGAGSPGSSTSSKRSRAASSRNDDSAPRARSLRSNASRRGPPSDRSSSDGGPRREAFDLRDLARGALSSFRDEAARLRLELVLEPGEPAPIEAERSGLEQVLANLIDNGLKYTERGRVTVRVGVQNGVAWGEVEDTGPGIPDGHLARVFERFYR